MAALERAGTARPGLLNRLATFLGIKRKEAQILFVGLDNSGNTNVVCLFVCLYYLYLSHL